MKWYDLFLVSGLGGRGWGGGGQHVASLKAKGVTMKRQFAMNAVKGGKGVGAVS